MRQTHSAIKKVNDFHLRRAVGHLRQGGVVAHATEGVWGLACNPFDCRAVSRILAIKGRSPDKGLILIGASADCFAPELTPLTASQRQAVQSTWPGPVSWVLPSQRFPVWITGAGQRRSPTVAVRVPGHAQARALCTRFGGPLVSTSANPSGVSATERVLRVRRWFGDAVDFIIPGQTLGRQGPSQLRTLAGEVLR